MSNYDDNLFNAGDDPWASSNGGGQGSGGSGSAGNGAGASSSQMFGTSSVLQDNNWSAYNSQGILSGTNNSGVGGAENEDYFAATEADVGGFGAPSSEAAGIGSGIGSGIADTDDDDNNPLDDSGAAAEHIIDSTPITKQATRHDGAGDDDPEEIDTYQVGGNSVWADDAIAQFSPLNYQNSQDKALVSVKEIPEKEGLVFKHINYLVVHNLRYSKEYYVEASENSKVKQTAPKSGETKVIRRYSDFDWLVEVLWKKYPFRLIPELPPKKFASSQSDPMFLQKRRRGLQRFLYQLVKHPVLSRENLVIMFLTVPNDFSNWKRFANIDLSDEFEGAQLRLPHRFRINMDGVMRGLRDTDSADEDSLANHSRSDIVDNETVGKNILEIWAESPVNHESHDFGENFNRLNTNLTRLADVWSKFTILVDRIERRESAVAADHQRAAGFIDRLVNCDTDVYGVDNLVENVTNQADDESQNLNIINTILKQVQKFFRQTKEIKEDEMNAVMGDVMEEFKKFQDYMTSLHFLMQRVDNYREESDKHIRILLSKVTRTNERLAQIKSKSDIKGSEVDRLVTISTQAYDQLNSVISKVILVKTTALYEYKLFQKTKYIISEALQDWFRQRSQYGIKQQDMLERVFGDLQDMPLR